MYADTALIYNQITKGSLMEFTNLFGKEISLDLDSVHLEHVECMNLALYYVEDNSLAFSSLETNNTVIGIDLEGWCRKNFGNDSVGLGSDFDIDSTNIQTMLASIAKTREFFCSFSLNLIIIIENSISSYQSVSTLENRLNDAYQCGYQIKDSFTGKNGGRTFILENQFMLLK